MLLWLLRKSLSMMAFLCVRVKESLSTRSRKLEILFGFSASR
jgi:hypothetical protein